MAFIDVDRLAVTDFARPRAAIMLAFVFAIVRLPWLWTGYGAETDAYRVALSALHFWRDGEYLPSRLPGYPVHELLMAPLVWMGGSVATDAATVLAAFAGVLLFARLARELGEPSPGLAVLGLSFTPFLLVNSVETKDYLWALAFLLGCYLAAVRGRPSLAGVLLGLAAGCRITSTLFALPLLLFFIGPRLHDCRDLEQRGWRPGLKFLAATALTTFLVFLPVTVQYGSGFFAYADSRISPDIVIRSIGQYSLGAIGALAVLGALLCSWRRLLDLPRLATQDVHVRIWLAAIALWVLAFLRLPIDIAYLIPVYPLGFLLLGRLLRPTLFAAALVAIFVSGLIDLDLSGLHNADLVAFARTARPCRSCAELFHDWHVRGLYRTYATALATASVPEHSVVLTGAVFPDFAVINWNRFQYGIVDRDRSSISMLSDDGMMRDDNDDVIYLASPDRPEIVDGFRKQGYGIFRSTPAGPAWQPELIPVR